MVAAFFIEILKKSSSKLRRKMNLYKFVGKSSLNNQS